MPRTTTRTAPGPRNPRLPLSIAAAVAMALASVLSTAAPAQAVADRTPAVAQAAADPATVLGVALPAQPYPPPGCAAQVDSTVVSAGDDVTVSGNCFRRFSTVTIRLDGTILATAIADSTGVVTETVTIPGSTPAGTHTITLSGVRPTGLPLTLSVDIQVV